VKGAEKKSPTWTEDIDPETLAIMRRQEALQPAVTALHEASMKSPDSGFTGIAFESDGLALYWKGPLTNDMLGVINTRYDGSGFDIERVPVSAAENVALARARAGRRSLRSAEQVLADLDLRIPVRAFRVLLKQP